MLKSELLPAQLLAALSHPCLVTSSTSERSPQSILSIDDQCIR
ncbi:hypothetical protein M3J09_007085 [Ascochyta lentis]